MVGLENRDVANNLLSSMVPDVIGALTSLEVVTALLLLHRHSHPVLGIANAKQSTQRRHPVVYECVEEFENPQLSQELFREGANGGVLVFFRVWYTF